MCVTVCAMMTANDPFLTKLHEALRVGIGIDADRRAGKIKLMFPKKQRGLAAYLKSHERDVCNWLWVFDKWPVKTRALIEWFINGSSFTILEDGDELSGIIEVWQTIKDGPRGDGAKGLHGNLSAMKERYEGGRNNGG